MYRSVIVLLLLLLPIFAVTITPDSIAISLLSSDEPVTIEAYSEDKIPDVISQGIHQISQYYSIQLDESTTHLFIPPNDHPFVISCENEVFFQRGYIDGTGTASSYNPSLIRIPHSGQNQFNFTVQIYPRGNNSSLIEIQSTDYESGSTLYFWSNFFNNTLLTAVVIGSFIIFGIVFLFWLTSGRNNKKFQIFCYCSLAIGFGYINVMFSFPGAPELLLWKLARICFTLAPTFLLLFTFSTLKKTYKLSVLPRVFLFLSAIFSVLILIQTSKEGIEIVFNQAVNIVGTPVLVAMLLVSLFAQFKEKQRSALLLTLGIVSIFAASMHDLYFFKTNQIPFCWLIAYGYLILEVGIVALLSQEIGKVFEQNRKKSIQLLHKNRELEKEKEVSEKIREGKDRFLKNMSHEFKTPLQGIVTTSELLRNQESSSDTISSILQALNIQMQKHLYNIQNVMDLSILEDAIPDVVIKTFEVQSLINNIELLFSHDERVVNKTLDISCSKSVPTYLNGDNEHLARILLSLLANICVSQKKCTVYLHILWNENTQELQCTFRNCKSCVNPSLTSFIRNDSLTAIEEADDLALSVALKLISIIDGTLELSEDNSQLILSAPLTEVKEFSQRDNSQSPGKILVAEDNHINRMVITKILEKLGYEVITAVNGKEAVEKTNDEHPSMILMDVQMPIKNGIEATREIRNQNNNDIVIVALTANATQDECLSAGMNDFLLKPARADELQRMINHYIGN